MHLLLVDDQDRWSELRPSDAARLRLGDPWELRGSYVEVVGRRHRPTAETIAETVIETEEITPLLRVSASTAPIVGSHPWVTILCRFAGSTETPHPANWYEQVMGSTYPGLQHYWGQVSFNNVDLTGSIVLGWYDLPAPLSAYMNGSDPDLDKLKDDCTGVADADVDFLQFAGVNLQFNQNFGGTAWGGGGFLSLDGEMRNYGMTWLPPWATQATYAHETGHGFGLPHSSGPYGSIYDSGWDVMSRSRALSDPTYGYIGQHTISRHKDMLGWIESARRYVPFPGATETIHLSLLAEPAPAGSYHIAVLQIPGGGFYTVEARHVVGYDNVPGEAIVLHKKLDGQGTQVVDADNNGNPNDAGAMWLPGETFDDPAAGITVAVESATSNGFNVSISLDGTGSPTPSIDLIPGGLDFTSPAGTNPNPKTFKIQNGGFGTLEWSASVDQSWLGLSSTSGSLTGGASETISVSIDATGLAPGRYNGNIAVSGNADNSPKTVLVFVEITGDSDPPPPPPDPAPQIALSPASIGVEVTAGGEPVSETIAVRNSGTGTLEWSIASSQEWLTFSPTSGSVEAGVSRGVTATIDPDGLGAGTHAATVTVTGNAGNSPQSLSVEVTVTAVPTEPQIALDPVSISVDALQGGEPVSRTVTVRNSGTGTLEWLITGNQSWGNWLTFEPGSGSLGAGASQEVTASIDPSSLTPGTHSATVQVAGNAGNSPRSLTVEVTVTAVQGPVLGVSPSSLEFRVKGNRPPGPKSTKISNSGRENLSWTAASNQPWLTLGGTAGTLAAGASQDVALSVNLEGLEAGTHTAIVTVSGNADNSPQTVTAVLKMSKGGAKKVKRRNLTFAASPSEQPMAESFELENTGDEEATWEASADQEWIVLEPSAGTLAAGKDEEVTVGVSKVGLPPGTHTGTITLSGDDEEPLSVTVSFTLVSGPGVRHTADEVAAHILGGISILDDDEIFYLDQVGNGNGRLEIGDLRAWLQQTGKLNKGPSKAFAPIGHPLSSPDDGTGVQVPSGRTLTERR